MYWNWNLKLNDTIKNINSSLLFKIILVMVVYLIFRLNKILGLVLVVFLLMVYYNCDVEMFNNYLLNTLENFGLVSAKSKSNIPVDKIIESTNIKNLRYGYKYNIIQIDSLAFKIFQMTKQNPKLLKVINESIIKIYGEIQANEKLKKYLEFNNLINDKGLPIFINENKDNLLINQIKILLVTIDKKDIEILMEL